MNSHILYRFSLYLSSSFLSSLSLSPSSPLYLYPSSLFVLSISIPPLYRFSPSLYLLSISIPPLYRFPALYISSPSLSPFLSFLPILPLLVSFPFTRYANHPVTFHLNQLCYTSHSPSPMISSSIFLYCLWLRLRGKLLTKIEINEPCGSSLGWM